MDYYAGRDNKKNLRNYSYQEMNVDVIYSYIFVKYLRKFYCYPKTPSKINLSSVYYYLSKAYHISTYSMPLAMLRCGTYVNYAKRNAVRGYKKHFLL
ncbi:hypothetical protein HBA_0046 [Sodalis endosymbiont of Henestaris halophilus]|nr:hypothetical protein HBA_0046 [Sodalis endosymbiont of Henestaris halophilus]